MPCSSLITSQNFECHRKRNGREVLWENRQQALFWADWGGGVALSLSLTNYKSSKLHSSLAGTEQTFKACVGATAAEFLACLRAAPLSPSLPLAGTAEERQGGVAKRYKSSVDTHQNFKSKRKWLRSPTIFLFWVTLSFFLLLIFFQLPRSLKKNTHISVFPKPFMVNMEEASYLVPLLVVFQLSGLWAPKKKQK